MNDAFLVGVLDGMADFDEQIETLLGAEVGLIAVVGDGYATDQFHHKVWAALLCGARIEHLGDVRMIHHRQRLALGFEPGGDLLRVHAQLDDLERDAAAHRFGLLSDIHDAAAAFADVLEQLVTAERLTHGFFG